MEMKMAANFAKIPRIKSHKQHAYPARLDAHLDKEMTPLFCAYVVKGMHVPIAAQNALIPSASKAPWIDLSYSAPTQYKQ
jgi:hypothetical protein